MPLRNTSSRHSDISGLFAYYRQLNEAGRSTRTMTSSASIYLTAPGNNDKDEIEEYKEENVRHGTQQHSLHKQASSKGARPTYLQQPTEITFARVHASRQMSADVDDNNKECALGVAAAAAAETAYSLIKQSPSNNSSLSSSRSVHTSLPSVHSLSSTSAPLVVSCRSLAGDQQPVTSGSREADRPGQLCLPVGGHRSDLRRHSASVILENVIEEESEEAPAQLHQDSCIPRPQDLGLTMSITPTICLSPAPSTRSEHTLLSGHSSTSSDVSYVFFSFFLLPLHLASSLLHFHALQTHSFRFAVSFTFLCLAPVSHLSPTLCCFTFKLFLVSIQIYIISSSAFVILDTDHLILRHFLFGLYFFKLL